MRPATVMAVRPRLLNYSTSCGGNQNYLKEEVLITVKAWPCQR